MQKQTLEREIFKYQSIDSAALAGAVIAGALSVFLAPGPFVPLNGMLGITLLVILFTYELKRYLNRSQNLAFGMVCAFCALLVVGFITEFYRGGWSLNYWEALEHPPDSRVEYWYLFLWWIFLTIIFTYIGSHHAIPLPSSTAEEPESPLYSPPEK